MFRTTAVRAASKTALTSRTQLSRTSVSKLLQQAQYQTSSRAFKTSPILALAVRQPLQKCLVRYQSTKRVVTRDTELEKKLGAEKVLGHPELISSTSSVHRTFTEVGPRDAEHDDVDMSAGIKGDFVRTLHI